MFFYEFFFSSFRCHRRLSSHFYTLLRRAYQQQLHSSSSRLFNRRCRCSNSYLKMSLHSVVYTSKHTESVTTKLSQWYFHRPFMLQTSAHYINYLFISCVCLDFLLFFWARTEKGEIRWPDELRTRLALIGDKPLYSFIIGTY